MRRIRVVLALALAGLTSAPVARADTGDVLRWQLIGHIAETPVVWLAVPPDGVGSGAMYAYVLDAPAKIAVRSEPGAGTTRRSRDGGQTWERMATEPPGRIILPPGGTTTLFSITREGVYRSADDGASWDNVFAGPGKYSQIMFSPAFRQDGTAFLLAADQLWRSTDGGATWTNLNPGEGQVISSARLSPAFATDQTIFVGAISVRPAYRSDIGQPTDNADSLGLLVSQDAGSTWSPISDGLQIDDVPYRQVLDIAVSPDFARDQTLFVSTLGPWVGRGELSVCLLCTGQSVAGFRSRDGGGSWDAVNVRTVTGFAVGAPLQLSPVFGADQTLEHGVDVVGSPAATRCSTRTSTDAGDSWTSAAADALGSNTQGMCAIGSARIANQTVLLGYLRASYMSSSSNRSVYRSLDSGASWSLLQPPGDGLVPGYQDDLAERQVILPDRVLQATQQGDLWAYAAWPPCTLQPQLGFGQVWSEHADWQEASGCALGPEQPIDIQTRHVQKAGIGRTDYYWTAGDAGACLVVYPTGERVHLGDAKNCSGEAERTLAGSMLPLANHQYWLYIPDGVGHGQVLSSLGSEVVGVP